MELTPQLLETQQFPEKWRGYDQDAVDEFLERVGVAVAELQDRLRSTSERIAELETSPPTAPAKSSNATHTSATAPTSPAATSTIDSASGTDVDASQVGRVLILAQAAADAAIAEAKAEAALIVRTANEKSDSVAGEARTKATTIESTAIQNADRLTAEANRRHTEATSKLDDADAHVAKLAQETVASAQAEATGLVAKAKHDADEMRSKAANDASAEAAQAIVSARAELTHLESTRSARQAEVSALDTELAGRQEALASVVGDLESLLGRVGALGGGKPTVAPAEAPSTAETSTPEPPTPASPAAARPADANPAPPVPRAQPTPVAPAPAVQSAPPAASAPTRPSARTATPTARMAPGFEGAKPDSVPSAVATLVDSEVPSATVVPTVTPEAVAPDFATIATTTTESDVIDLTDAAVAEQDELKDLWAGIAAPASVSSGSAVVDDPFLAALRGPDRVEFDGSGEPDDDRSGFRRRRRTRRL